MRMSREEFEQHVLSAYEQLPQEARAAVDEGNIDIVVEDWPGPESEGPLTRTPDMHIRRACS